MNGIDLYDRLHVIERLERVPTIMLSVHASLREINQRQIMFMRKPFDMFKLLEAIDTFLV
jgi:hypothetical protein